jgi:hypothetical protein
MEGSELEELLRKIAPESHTTCELPGDILCLYKGGTFYHWFLFIFSRIRAATSLTFFVLIFTPCQLIFPRINLPQVLKGVPAAYLMEGAPASFPTGLSKKSCLCS